MIKFDVNNVLLLHQLVIKSSGGIDGVRDFSLLDSALNVPFQTFDNQDLYPSIEEKGARLGYNIIANHAFFDGNKRIGLLVMLSFLEVNGIKLHYTDKDLIEIGFSIADGKMNYDELITWIGMHKKQNLLSKQKVNCKIKHRFTIKDIQKFMLDNNMLWDGKKFGVNQKDNVQLIVGDFDNSNTGIRAEVKFLDTNNRFIVYLDVSESKFLISEEEFDAENFNPEEIQLNLLKDLSKPWIKYLKEKKQKAGKFEEAEIL